VQLAANVLGGAFVALITLNTYATTVALRRITPGR
jgi:hypothetical protein